jgi:tetratricopeptide (TPR) repeat protein
MNFRLIQGLSKEDTDAVKLTIELVDKYMLQEQPGPRNFILVEVIRCFLYEQLSRKEKEKRPAHREAGECLAHLAENTADEALRLDYLYEAIYHFNIGGPRKQLLKISDELYEPLCNVGDYERASIVARTAISCAKEEQANNIIAIWLLRAAEIELLQEHRGEIDRLFEEATALLPDPQKKFSESQNKFWNDLKSQIYFIKGRFFYNTHEYSQSRDCFEKCIQVIENWYDFKGQVLSGQPVERQQTL